MTGDPAEEAERLRQEHDLVNWTRKQPASPASRRPTRCT